MKKYLVGGAVRDLVLGIKPKDHDYVIVGASEQDVQNLIAEGYKQVGADFPVFLHPVTGEEHALARVERKVSDGYHGFTVETAGVSLEDDLARRDFTMNAMAVDPDTGDVIDPFNGRADIAAETIRHTTAAFAEDPLRVLRAARFAARFGFTICDETFKLCRQMIMAGDLRSLTHERIVLELVKGFGGPNAAGFLGELVVMGAKDAHPILHDLLSKDRRFAYTMVEAIDDMILADGVEKHRLCMAALTQGTYQNSKFDTRQNRLDIAVQSIMFMIDGGVNVRSAFRLAQLSQSQNIVPLVKAFIEATRLCGNEYARGIDLKTFDLALSVNGRVSAADFPEIAPGPQLGGAIERRKLELISDALQLPVIP